MFPASRAAWVPVFIATPTSACASAGASFVPSPVIATSRPSSCSRRISSSLASGVASARKSSTPASSAIAAAVSGLSPVTITVWMPIARSWSKRWRMPSLTTSRSSMTPSTCESRATASGVPPSRPMRSSSACELGRRLAALVGDPAQDRVAGALAQPRAVDVDAAHPRLRGERHELRLVRRPSRARAGRTAWRARRSSGPRASRRPATTAAPPRPARPRLTPGIGMNAAASRLPSVIVPVLSSSSTSTSPDASTARPDSASTLRRTSRSMPAMPIALSSAPIVVGISATSSAMSVAVDASVSGEVGERPQRDDDDEEDQRQPGEQDARARSRSASCAARRPRRGRSSGRGTTARAPA